MENKKELDENNIRVIKISQKALFEFIYEKFIDDKENFFEVDPLDVTDHFDINFERNEFIFCVQKSADSKGKIIEFPKEIDLQQLMINMQDTTSSMYTHNRYREFTKEELIKLSKKL